MSVEQQRNLFIAWMTTLALGVLHNEDDVETKFVLPLFEHLGYPESHRRGKYPVVEQSGSQGRKKEIDQVYFSLDDASLQTENTALVLVEAKRQDVADLSKAVQQAQSYGHWLKPLLLVITNSRQLIILRRHRYRADEHVFNAPVDTLSDPVRAGNLYDQLNFETVCQLKQRLVDELNHEQLVRLEQALQAYPDIQAILTQGDFVPNISYEGRQLVVVRRKVAIEGELPLAFGEGSCTITFSHVLRRGLRIHLSHHDILAAFMIGIGTPPAWQARRFIDPEGEGLFRVRLGRTTTLLSDEEADDLCACIDTFAKKYRAVIFETEDLLKTWRSHLVPTFDGLGCYLLSVRAATWRAMRRFGEEFDWGNGNTPWHIFERYAPALRISHSKQDHAFIYGFEHLPDHVSLLSGYVHLVHVLPGAILKQAEHESQQPWPLSIGQHGLWTADYTQRWVEQEFLPRLRSHRIGRELGGIWERDVMVRDQDLAPSYPESDVLPSAEALIVFIEDIHLWLTSYQVKTIPTESLRNLFIALLKLAQHADPTHIDLHYAASRAGVKDVEQSEFVQFQFGKNPQRASEVYSKILTTLQEHVAQMATVPYVSPYWADYLIRSLHAILEDGRIKCSQATLNDRTYAVG
jgi:hypothetical protein